MLTKKKSIKQLLTSLVWCLTGVFFLFPLTLTGQEKEEYSVFNYSVDRGLSQSTVYAIHQDAQGFIWIGTRGGGLNRFDGYDFKVFRSSHNDPFSISGNEVIAIYEDHEGSLWVGNRFSGLDRFDRNREQFIHYRLEGVPGSNTSVNCFLEDQNGKLWMGCDAGLFYYEAGADSFIRIDPEKPVQVSTICSGEDGGLILSSRNGIYHYRPLSGEFEKKVDVSLKGLEQGRQWNAPMIIDSKKNIWYGCLKGLYLVKNLETADWVRNPLNIPELENVHIRSIAEDKNGCLWIGCPSGLIRVNPVNGNYVLFNHNDNDPESIGHSSVYSVLEDDMGNMWVGTWGGGVSMLSYLPRKFLLFRHIPFTNSLSNNLVSSFVEDEEGLWIGTEAGGLNFYDPKTGLFTVYRKTGTSGITSDHIKCVIKDSENKIWAGTWGKGIFRFDRLGGTFHHFLGDQSVFTMREDHQGTLWVGTLNGLYKMDKKSGEFAFYSPDNHSGLNDYFITSLFCDDRGNLWAGTKTGGLHLYNPLKDNFLSYRWSGRDSSGIIDNYIISINQDSDRNLWIGTNKGLCRFNYKDGTFEDFSFRADFPDQVINGIIPDNNGKIWITTNGGLSCFSPGSDEITNFDMRDGLQSNEFSRGAYFISKTGEIFIGGINGFNSFKPEKIQYNLIPPKIVITELKLYNQPIKADLTNKILYRHISQTGHITLNHKQSVIELDFVALNYLYPSKNSYKYTLEGYTKGWIELESQRRVSFMNLEEGDYIFRITGSNNDGVWNERGAELRITIKPPPWKSPLAYLVYFFLILSVLYYFWKAMISRIEQKNQVEMQQREKERIKELNNLKLQFFTNITHELRTPLSLITGPVDMLMQDNLTPENKSFYYRVIRNNINRLKRLVDQILEFRKAENEKLALHVQAGNLHLFLHSLFENFTGYARKKEIDFRLNSSISDDEQHWFDHDFLDKILFNLFSNAFKFTPAGGKIEISAGLDGQQAHISVKDSGKGISRDNLPWIFERFYDHKNPKGISGSGIGLFLSKRLVETHKGTISATSHEGEGSEFRISFPVGRAHYRENEIVGPENAGMRFPVETSEDYTGTEVSESTAHLQENVDDDLRSVLIVDDNREMVACLQNYLAGKYLVRTAYDGKEALNIAREKFPSLIVTDLKMPEMDGLELCDKIKSDALINHIPVIILSAKTGIDSQIEGLNKGADAYIEKPFDFIYLETVIENLITRRESLRKRFALENIGPASLNLDNPGEKFMEKAMEKVTQNLSNQLYSVDDLSSALNMSRSQLFRKFRSLIGMSPSDFIRITRLRKAALMILKEDIPVSQVATEVGFTTPSHFISAFKKLYGTTPKQYVSAKKGFHTP